MNLQRTFFTVFIVMVLFSCTTAGKPDVSIENAKIMASPMIIGGGSAFMVIRNNGKGSDTLIGCSIKEYADAHGMLHDFEDGKMIMVDEINIPAGGTTELKRGSKHLMFSGLPEQLGDSVTIMLNFRQSGTIEVNAKVEIPQEMGH